MTYTNCRRFKIEIWFVPPFARGWNSFWRPQPDGSVLLMYKYHEQRTINGQSWSLTQLN